jgi:hypothetical protein
MPRVRADNDARYALRASFVDEDGNVLEGPIVIGSSNDPRISDTDIANWNTAYGWGDHASAGYASLTSSHDIDRAAGGYWSFKSSGNLTASDGTANAIQVYADNGNDAFMTFHVGGDFATNLGLDRSTNRLGYGGWSAGSTFYKFWSTQDFASIPSSPVSSGTNGGNYGSVYIDGGATGGWEGYSIGGRSVFMHDNSSTTGLYDDVNNKWLFRAIHKDASYMYYNGSIKGYTYGSGFRVTGNLLASSDVYAYYSDERLKDVVGRIEKPLESIGAIETFYYTHNDKARELGYEGSERQVGVSAQSVQAVLPEVIGRAPIDDDGEGGSVTGEDYITVQYHRIVPLLIEGIKELTSELEAVKLELKELKSDS